MIESACSYLPKPGKARDASAMPSVEDMTAAAQKNMMMY